VLLLNNNSYSFIGPVILQILPKKKAQGNPGAAAAAWPILQQEPLKA